MDASGLRLPCEGLSELDMCSPSLRSSRKTPREPEFHRGTSTEGTNSTSRTCSISLWRGDFPEHFAHIRSAKSQWLNYHGRRGSTRGIFAYPGTTASSKEVPAQSQSSSALSPGTSPHRMQRLRANLSSLRTPAVRKALKSSAIRDSFPPARRHPGPAMTASPQLADFHTRHG